MEKVIVYVDDATYAQQMLAPLLARAAAAQTHWVLVACAPRMTHRISKWVSHSARENWRAKWADKLFAQMLPLLGASPGSVVTTVVAKGPLAELTEQLHGTPAGQTRQPTHVQVVDARRPKADAPDSPEAARAGQRFSSPLSGTLGSWGSLLTGVGALWALALE